LKFSVNILPSEFPHFSVERLLDRLHRVMFAWRMVLKTYIRLLFSKQGESLCARLTWSQTNDILPINFVERKKVP